MTSFRTLGLLFTVSVLMVSFATHTCFAVDEIEARGLLHQAEQDLTSAYVAVGAAKTGGANVSALIVRLDEAGGLLARGNGLLGVGDYGNASLLAVQCSYTVLGVVDAAETLKVEAEARSRDGLFVSAAVSSVGLSVLFVATLLGWNFFKKRYFRQVLDMKPEVGGTE
jgi:hypothetical protein